MGLTYQVATLAITILNDDTLAPFQITAMDVSGTEVIIDFEAAAGVEYRLLASPDLEAWTDVEATPSVAPPIGRFRIARPSENLYFLIQGTQRN